MLLVATRVMSLPTRFTSATPSGIVYSSCWHRPFQLVHHFVFEEDHGIVVADSAFEQTLGIVGRGGNDDFQSGNMAQPGVQALAVLRGGAARGAEGCPQDHRHFEFAAGHVVDLGSLIHELVHRQCDEVAEHDVHHRAHPGHGGADADAADARFGNGRIDDALGAEFRPPDLKAL